MTQWTIGAVLDAIAETVPDRLLTVCGRRRSTFGESADRTRRLANFLAGHGFGTHRERGELQNWECGQDRVALIMHNDLYPDMVIGCLKARTVPANVNYNYTPREVAELLEYLRPRAVIYHRSLGPKFADVLPPASADLLISVDDDSDVPELTGATKLEDALAQGDIDHDITPSPDDLPVVLYDRTKFDPPAVLETAEREKVGMMTMVGDAYAGPLVEELRKGSYDLSSLFAIGTGGAAINPKYQRALLELLPQITLINGYGSSETGNVGFGRSQRGAEKDTFELRDGALVVSEDYSRFLQPGEQEIGYIARAGRIPLGYFDDPVATQKTFPVVEGQRVVISGDRGSLASDGTMRLFGRDSLVINTGGEKVFVEEVEEVLRAHPAIADALVVGRPSERWGQEVVALVALREGAEAAHEPLHAHCTSQLARFKTPKEYIFVEQVRRLGNGKADYRWAKCAATQQESLT